MVGSRRRTCGGLSGPGMDAASVRGGVRGVMAIDIIGVEVSTEYAESWLTSFVFFGFSPSSWWARMRERHFATHAPRPAFCSAVSAMCVSAW